MPVQKSNVYPNRRATNADDDFDLREILAKYLYYWPLFALFLIVTTIAAYAYYRVTKPVYDVKATMLLQEGKENSDVKSALQELDILSAPKSVENQLEILQSRRIIEMVVNHLQLWVTYKVSKHHLKEDLYKNSPVKFNLIKGRGELKGKISIIIKNADTFILQTSDDPDIKGEEFNFDSTIKSPIGTWKIDATPNIRNFIGSTIIIYLNEPTATVDNYQTALEVVLKDKMESSAVDITVKDQIPQRGKDFVNYLIAFYNKTEDQEKAKKTRTTLDFIDKRLDSLTVELNLAEKRVENYRSARGLTDINAQSQVFLQNEQSNDARLNEVNVQLKVINDIENYINSPNVTEKTVPSTINISDQNLIALVQRYTDEQQERSQLLATTPEKNPIFEPLNKRIANTRAAIRENIQNIKSSLQTTKGALQNFGSRFRSSIENIPGQERELTGLKREQGIKENLYTYLLQKREELSLSYASTLSNARLVDYAYVLPLNKSKQLMPFIVALILGFLFPAAIIYLRDTIKNQVTSRRDIEKGLPIPIVAELEYQKLKSPIVTDAVNDKHNFMLVEQFRSLRTQLHYLHNSESKGRVTLIASSVAEEGRSFVASNLGVALATSGKRTIILELNLYRPIMSEIFGLPDSHPGMSNYLNWASLKEEVIQNTITYRNLDVITSGQFIPNFSELLDRKRIDILLDWLRLHYDHILIDTSPLQVIGDANIVSRLCDITLYLVRKDFTSKTQIPFINKLYADQQLPNMSIVFNGIDKVLDGYKDYFPAKG